MELKARQAVVTATGSEPLMPDIAGLAVVGPWTPREAVSASLVPPSLIVVGAGPVGAELATAYAQLGSEVTLVAGSERVLGRFEPEASRRVSQGMEAVGIKVVLGTQVKSVKREGERVWLHYRTALMSRGMRSSLRQGERCGRKG